MTSIPEDPPEWLASTLSSILSAPHITIPPAPGGRPEGPGPIDLFTTRFDNAFTDDAKAIVDGRKETLDGLKATLLALQKHWNAQTAKFTRVQSIHKHLTSTSCTWTQTDSELKLEFEASAKIVESGGSPRISEIILQGKASLFN